MSFIRSEGRRLPRQRKLLLFAAAAAVLFFLLRETLIQLSFQIGLAVLLSWAARPICVRLERRFPPGIAALLSLLSFVAVLLLFLLLLIPQLITQAGLAVSAVPQLIGILQNAIDRLTQSPFFDSVSQFLSPSGDLLKKTGEVLLSVIPQAVQTLGRIVSRVMRAFLAPALAFYFLRDREAFCFQLSLCIPLSIRQRTLTALREMRREVAGYFRGQMLVSGAVALLTAFALLVLGVPSWLPLGILMGICDFVPYIGPYLGAVPIVLFSLPQGLHAALWSIAAVVVVQQIESIFLSPHFMSGATGLHPAYVLLLLSAGGFMGGLMGMLLALPLFVCIRGAVRALQCAAQPKHPAP